MKKCISCLIALFCVIGLAGVWQLRQPQIQKKIALSLMPSESHIGSIQIDGKSIYCSKIKIPLKNDNSIEVETFRAQYDFWESIKNRQIQLLDCQADGCKLLIRTKRDARTLTQEHSSTAQVDTAWQMPQSKIPPLSIRSLQLSGLLKVQDQLDSEFRLEAKNIGLDQVCELSLSANTEFETTQAISLDQIETVLKSRFEMTKNGQIWLHNVTLHAHSQDLTAQIEMLKPTDIENQIFWQGTLHYSKETPQEYAFGNTSLSVLNAELILNGSLQLGREVSIDLAQLQLMTAPFGNIEVHSRQSMHYPLLKDINGDLCSIRIPELALSAVKDWLPPGYSLESDTAACNFVLSKDGEQYALRSEQHISWSAVELMGPHGPMDTGIDSIKLSPEVFFKPPETLKVSIPDLRLSQKSKPVLIADIEAECMLSQLADCSIAADFSFMPDGIVHNSAPQNLNISGKLYYQANDEWPIQLATQLIPDNPANTQDSLELRIQSKLAPQERLPIKIHTFIGQQPTPSSEFQLNATLNLLDKPLKVSAQIDSPGSQLCDLKRWLEYFIHVPLAQISPPSTSHIHSQAATKIPSSSPAAWGAIDAQITAHLQNLEINPKQVVSNLHLESTISPQSLDIQECTVQIKDANIQATLRSDYKHAVTPHYRNQLDLSFKNIQALDFLSHQQSWKIDGFFEGVLTIDGQADDWLQAWKNSLGRLSVRSQNGQIELLELSRRKSLGIAGAGLLGFGLSALLDQPEIHKKTQAGIALVPYFKQIDYQVIELECVRETLELIDIPRLQLLSPELRIQGFGALGAQPIEYLLQQPLLCELSLASKGPILESLQVLDLIKSMPDADNFFDWKQTFEISGSLEKPNTDSFSDFFQQEARNFLRSPDQTTEPSKPTIDLGNGIDVLEKLFHSKNCSPP